MGKVDIFLLLCVSFLCLVEANKFVWRQNEMYMVITQHNLTEGCFNKKRGDADYVSFDDPDNTGECVVIYYEKDCKGAPIKPPRLEIDSDESRRSHEWIYPNLPNYSYHLCSWKRPDNISTPRINVLYTSNSGNYIDTVYQFENLKQCKNLPDSVAGKVSHVFLHNEEPCLRLYKGKDCEGEVLELKETRMDHRYWVLRNQDYLSINGCPDVQLHAEIVKFRFRPNAKKKVLTGFMWSDELGKKATFINNSSSPITKTYEGRKTFQQRLFFRNIESLIHMHSVEVKATSDLDSELGAIFDGMRIPTELKSAYESRSDILPHRRRHQDAESYKDFLVHSTFVIPPCSEYEVKSLLFYNNAHLGFELDVIVSGTSDGESVPGKLVREALPPGMEYVRDITDQVIFARTHGELVANVGVRSEVKTNVKLISDCEQNEVCKSYSICFNKVDADYSFKKIEIEL